MTRVLMFLTDKTDKTLLISIVCIVGTNEYHTFCDTFANDRDSGQCKRSGLRPHMNKKYRKFDGPGLTTTSTIHVYIIDNSFSNC